MNNDMMRRIMMRDMARKRDMMMNDRNYNNQNMRDSRDYQLGTMRDNNQMDSRRDYYNQMTSPSMYQNQIPNIRDFNNDFNQSKYNNPNYREQDFRYGDFSYQGQNFQEDFRGDYRDRGHGNYTQYPFEVSGNFVPQPYYPYMGQDFNSNKKLSQQELKEIEMKFLNSIDEKDKQSLNKEIVLKKAENLGIKFDKFSPEEFYVAVLMKFKCYSKTLGTVNIDTYLKLAKDWLTEEDSKIKAGEKLAAYNDYIIEGK